MLKCTMRIIKVKNTIYYIVKIRNTNFISDCLEFVLEKIKSTYVRG